MNLPVFFFPEDQKPEGTLQLLSGRPPDELDWLRGVIVGSCVFWSCFGVEVGWRVFFFEFFLVFFIRATQDRVLIKGHRNSKFPKKF